MGKRLPQAIALPLLKPDPSPALGGLGSFLQWRDSDVPVEPFPPTLQAGLEVYTVLEHRSRTAEAEQCSQLPALCSILENAYPCICRPIQPLGVGYTVALFAPRGGP